MPFSFSPSGAALSRSTPSIITNIQARRLTTCLDVFREYMHFPEVFEVVKVLLGAVAANAFPDTPPVWLMLVGPSGGGKSTLCETLRWHKDAHYCDELTEPGLLGWGKDAGGNPVPTGVLPDEIGSRGMMIVSEFSTILASNHHKQRPILALLRRVYDGHLKRKISCDAPGLSLEWSGHCGLIGASAPGIDTHREVISEMGERFVYYQIEYSQEDEERVGRLAGATLHRRKDRAGALSHAVRDVLSSILSNPAAYANRRLTVAETSRMTLMSQFAAWGRSVTDRAASWNRELEYVHTREFGTGRLFDGLSAIFRGMLAVGVGYAAAWAVLDKIMLNSIPTVRRLALLTILERTDPCSAAYYGGLRQIAKQIEDRNPYGVGVSHRVLARALEDLTAHRALQQKTGGRKGIMDAWRVTPPVWELYARLQDAIPPEPDSEDWSDSPDSGR